MTAATAQSPAPVLAMPRYTALALQTRCDAVNQDSTRDAARARMTAAITRVGAQIGAARGFLQGFNGYPVRLVVLPEYWMTGFPLGETRAQWQDKAAIAPDGIEIEAIGALAARHQVFLCSNHYETDPHFPHLYFQANVVFSPAGDVVLRYRRMISLYAPTPYDVWDRYLEVYGAEGVFPVAESCCIPRPKSAHRHSHPNTLPSGPVRLKTWPMSCRPIQRALRERRCPPNPPTP
ncbi:MAG: hypothetical protein MUF14_11470 [Hyphomonadaceae bacterium]|nr:hypothetical protein [Hyphomonadaceae bacterium]